MNIPNQSFLSQTDLYSCGAVALGNALRLLKSDTRDLSLEELRRIVGTGAGGTPKESFCERICEAFPGIDVRYDQGINALQLLTRCRTLETQNIALILNLAVSDHLDWPQLPGKPEPRHYTVIRSVGNDSLEVVNWGPSYPLIYSLSIEALQVAEQYGLHVWELRSSS